MDFSRDLYTHGIIDDKEMYSIKDDYDYSKIMAKTKKKTILILVSNRSFFTKT